MKNTFITTFIILVFLIGIRGNFDKNATKALGSILNAKRSKISWKDVQRQLPLGLLLSKRGTSPNHQYLGKIVGKNTVIDVDVHKKISLKANGILKHKSTGERKAVRRQKNGNNRCTKFECTRKPMSLTGESKCCVCCKRNLTKQKMKKVIGLLRDALLNLQYPPSKKKLRKPQCDMGMGSLPCSNSGCCGCCGCCGQCGQMVKVKYHPPKFDFKAMKGQLMCGCGFGNPCGGCLMRT